MEELLKQLHSMNMDELFLFVRPSLDKGKEVEGDIECQCGCGRAILSNHRIIGSFEIQRPG